ncbi:ribbon-helix-helix domain-containing protein [Parvularcula sp. IMCC14364]|uniref:ribbon-helix-helix domain-containing protein n=1 Tax=Parvularcula sp. IMCC14364 TaxID=3067902 RepID=UPI0027428072|nr:ribbon-helix-helix domain-containing protein [Parvularcula sp. IMCC14364]
MKKRSVSIAGHRTSISLEQPFWDELSRLATLEARSLASLIAQIDRERMSAADPHNLSSALRLYILKRLKEESAK